jgi:hypothetical protein
LISSGLGSGGTSRLRRSSNLGTVCQSLLLVCSVCSVLGSGGRSRASRSFIGEMKGCSLLPGRVFCSASVGDSTGCTSGWLLFSPSVTDVGSIVDVLQDQGLFFLRPIFPSRDLGITKTKECFKEKICKIDTLSDNRASLPISSINRRP